MVSKIIPLIFLVIFSQRVIGEKTPAFKNEYQEPAAKILNLIGMDSRDFFSSQIEILKRPKRTSMARQESAISEYLNFVFEKRLRMSHIVMDLPTYDETCYYMDLKTLGENLISWGLLPEQSSSLLNNTSYKTIEILYYLHDFMKNQLVPRGELSFYHEFNSNLLGLNNLVLSLSSLSLAKVVMLKGMREVKYQQYKSFTDLINFREKLDQRIKGNYSLYLLEFLLYRYEKWGKKYLGGVFFTAFYDLFKTVNTDDMDEMSKIELIETFYELFWNNIALADSSRLSNEKQNLASDAVYLVKTINLVVKNIASIKGEGRPSTEEVIKFIKQLGNIKVSFGNIEVIYKYLKAAVCLWDSYMLTAFYHYGLLIHNVASKSENQIIELTSILKKKKSIESEFKFKELGPWNKFID